MRAPPYNPAQSKRGSNVDEDEMRGDDEFGRRCDERDVRRRFGSKQGCAVDQEAGWGDGGGVLVRSAVENRYVLGHSGPGPLLVL